MLIVKKQKRILSKKFTFKAESGWVKVTVSELKLKSETIATQITETEVKVSSQIISLFIY